MLRLLHLHKTTPGFDTFKWMKYNLVTEALLTDNKCSIEDGCFLAQAALHASTWIFCSVGAITKIGKVLVTISFHFKTI